MVDGDGLIDDRSVHFLVLFHFGSAFCMHAEQLAIVRFFNFAPTFVDASWKEGWSQGRATAATCRFARCDPTRLPVSGLHTY